MDLLVNPIELASPASDEKGALVGDEDDVAIA